MLMFDYLEYGIGHLTKWYLTKSNDEEPNQKSTPTKVTPQSKPNHPPLSFKRRYPLPDDFQFQSSEEKNDGNYELHGYIVPSSTVDDTNQSSKQYDYVPIVLTALMHWDIDLSFQMRGIWVKTESAWYYLKDPCHSSVLRVSYFDAPTTSHSPDPYLPSQATLNLPLRAKLGLLSNILDMLSEKRDSDDDDYVYAKIHATIPVEKCHYTLCLDSTILKTKYSHIKPPLNEEPFDINLLKQKGVAKFIRNLLINYHEALSDESIFIKSFDELEQLDQKKVNQHVWRDDDYRESAQVAERRSKREMWGEALSTTCNEEVHPNRLLLLEHENHLIEESQALKKAVEGTAAKILGDETNHIFCMNEKAEFDENNMKECITLLSIYLSPIKMDKFHYTNFVVQDEKIDDLLQSQVLNDTILSLESMLLIVSVISRSSDKVMKSLFKMRRSEDSNKSPGSLIFRYWLSYAINIMERRRHRFSKSKPKSGEVRTEELITAAIMELIVNYRVIKTSKQIDTLKTKYNVDWIDYVEKVRRTNIFGVCSFSDLYRV